MRFCRFGIVTPLVLATVIVVGCSQDDDSDYNLGSSFGIGSPGAGADDEASNPGTSDDSTAPVEDPIDDVVDDSPGDLMEQTSDEETGLEASLLIMVWEFCRCLSSTPRKRSSSTGSQSSLANTVSSNCVVYAL